MSATGQPDQTESKLLEILEAIRELTPTQRRRLQRRLRISGLLVQDEYVADRDRLRVAPALNAISSASSGTPVEPQGKVQKLRRAKSEDEQSADVPSSDDPLVRDIIGSDLRGDGKNSRLRSEPQAAEAADLDEPVQIEFDGSVRGEAKQGFGSYSIRIPGESQEIVQLRFGENCTEAEAAFDTLIAALEATLKCLGDRGVDAASCPLILHGESANYLEQLTGQTEIEKPQLRLRCDRVQYLLRKFRRWEMQRKSSDSSQDSG